MGLATGNSPESGSGPDPTSPGRFVDLSQEADPVTFVPGLEFRPTLGERSMLMSVSSAPYRGPGLSPPRGADDHRDRWRTGVRGGRGRSSAYAWNGVGNLAQRAPQGSQQGDRLAGTSRCDGLTAARRGQREDFSDWQTAVAPMGR
jgi:hypothetical protein